MSRLYATFGLRITGRYVLGTVLMACVVVLGSAAQESENVTSDGWRRAIAGYRLQFPLDHGSHPDYRIEWWYYTGNLASDDGRRFGYQVTFFRIGIDPDPENPSRWAVRDLFMTHFAVTDIGDGNHRIGERINRGGVGWAGARVGTLDVWNGDWRVKIDGQQHQLRLVERQFSVDLRLEPGKGITLHAGDGFSRKGREVGNASYYYSMTRMPTSGSLTIDGETIEVSGLSWMDHEFGSTFLEASQVGWDWFSLQLDDDSELMVFQIRGAAGQPDRYSSGTWVDADGVATRLSARDFTLLPRRRWLSPLSDAVYPVEWRIELPNREVLLDVSAAVDKQELDTSASTTVTYWEGAVTVSGQVGDRPVRGSGYLEMTGYAGRPMSEVFR